MWLYLSLVSALFLGFYDLGKKKAVEHNDLLPSVFFCTLWASLLLLPLTLIFLFNPAWAKNFSINLSPQPFSIHLAIALKSAIVGLSWLLSYSALKHLPLSVATPLRASAPLFTLLGAVLLLGEKLTLKQTCGILVLLLSYILYCAKKSNHKQSFSYTWAIVMLLASLVGAVSAGYDKYLIQTRGIPPLFVLAFFLNYLTLLYGLPLLYSQISGFNFSQKPKFKLIFFLVGFLLVAADLCYMYALTHPSAQIAVVSALRRTNVLVSFGAGIIFLKEKPTPQMYLALGGILVGLFLITF